MWNCSSEHHVRVCMCAGVGVGGCACLTMFTSIVCRRPHDRHRRCLERHRSSHLVHPVRITVRMPPHPNHQRLLGRLRPTRTGAASSQMTPCPPSPPPQGWQHPPPRPHSPIARRRPCQTRGRRAPWAVAPADPHPSGPRPRPLLRGSLWGQDRSPALPRRRTLRTRGRWTLRWRAGRHCLRASRAPEVSP